MPMPVEPEFATLHGLLQHYSPSGAEGAAVRWLVERMRQLGFTHSSIDPAGNAVGVLGDGHRQVVLLGHIDTVEGEIPLRLEGEALYGRGSVDAKGALAAFVDTAAAAGVPAGWQVVVIGAVGEESDSHGARYLVDQYRPEYVIVGEPSGWQRLTLGYKGSAWAELLVSRPRAHSASAHEGACEHVFTLWAQVKALAESYNANREQLFDQLQVSLRGLASGEDGFAEWAGLRVGARLPLDLPPGEWYARLEELAAGAKVVQAGFAIPAYRGDKNTPLARAFLAAIRQAGGQPGFVLKTGTADLNIVAPPWNCPAAAYGPGDSALDHTPEEHLPLAEYLRAVAVLSTVLRRICAA